MHHVYALLCANRDLYIGSCSDIKKRVNRHKSGLVRSTKSKLPVKLIYFESYSNKRDAIRREKQLKQHKPREILKERVKYSIK